MVRVTLDYLMLAVPDGRSHDLELLQPLLEQLHLVVGVGVLRLQVLVLFLQLLQLVRHPVLDAGSLGLNLFCVGQTKLALKYTKKR